MTDVHKIKAPVGISQLMHWLRGKIMVSHYHMDLDRFSLEAFKHILQTEHLLPSQRILKESIVERFATLASMGIGNLKDLLNTLSTKKKIEQFAQASGLSQAYLTILRRRAGIYTPDPIALSKFSGITPEHIQSLSDAGIKDTKHLFDRAWARQSRAELAKTAHVPEDVLLELVKLSDLARAPYVGAVWARLFYVAGADTLEKLAESQPEELCERLKAVNDRYQLTKGGLPTVKDMAAGLTIYRMIPRIVEY